MAQRRMFSLQIVDSDAFLDMPVSAQVLYFHLSMRADDDGFVGNPKKVMRMVGVNDDDLKVLMSKRFILTFESGVIVIKHWKIHNYIQNDRYHETKYVEEKHGLDTKDNGAYTEKNKDVSKMDTEARLELGKASLGKDRLGKVRERTPAQEAKDFFEQGETYYQLLQEVTHSSGAPPELVEKEFQKFHSYWTELNKSGTRQKWEQESTFEVRKRLKTWFSRIEFKSKAGNKYTTGAV
jgi:hypothetical protein